MGNDKTTRVSSEVQLPAMDAVNKPRPSNFDPKHPTGIPIADSGAQGACDAEPGKAGCFLSEKQRAGLVIGYNGRVGDVGVNCHGALEHLEIEQLVKNTDELPWYASLIVAALAAVLTEGLSALIESGVGLATSVAVGSEAVGTVNAEIADVSVARMHDLIAITPPHEPASKPSPAKAIAGKAVDTGRQAASKPLGATAGPTTEAGKEKETSISYLQFIDAAVTAEFDRLKQVIPGVATDAELVLLYNYFDPKKHTKEMYIARFREKLDRYLHSNASKIGRTSGWDERRGPGRFELETRVAWLITKGAGQRLIYVDRAFDATYERLSQGPQHGFSRSRAYDSGTNQLSLQDDATWSSPLGEETRHEKPVGPDLMLNYVEPEFKSVALAAQAQIWLAPPETFMLDYSYAPPRMVKVAS